MFIFYQNLSVEMFLLCCYVILDKRRSYNGAARVIDLLRKKTTELLDLRCTEGLWGSTKGLWRTEYLYIKPTKNANCNWIRFLIFYTINHNYTMVSAPKILVYEIHQQDIFPCSVSKGTVTPCCVLSACSQSCKSHGIAVGSYNKNFIWKFYMWKRHGVLTATELSDRALTACNCDSTEFFLVIDCALAEYSPNVHYML